MAPDVQKVGGLAETRRIAALADVHSLPVAPHNIAGPVGTMASVHVCASIPNFLALEWHASSVPFFDDLVVGVDGPIIRDGYVTVPDAPGIGVDLDLDRCREFALKGEPFFGEDNAVSTATVDRALGQKPAIAFVSASERVESVPPPDIDGARPG